MVNKEQALNGRTNPEIKKTNCSKEVIVVTPEKLEQVDYEYKLIKESLFPFPNYGSSSFRDLHLTDIVENSFDGSAQFNHLMCTWFVDISHLTKSQKKLNKELLNILNADPYTKDINYRDNKAGNDYITRLVKFLRKNKNNQDLETVLNLERGESKLTVLHALSSMAWRSRAYDYSVDLILRAGADPNKKNDRGKTPLHCATGTYSITALLRAGADPSIRDRQGKTPFHCCAAQPNNIASFLRKGVDINIKDSEEKTLLHYAAEIGCDESVNLLLKNGANSNICDRQGKTPLQVAIDNHNYHIEECFLTDSQKRLSEELYYNIIKRPGSLTENLKEFLRKHKKEDLKVVLNIRNKGEDSKVLNHCIVLLNPQVKDLLLEAGATDFKRLDREEKPRDLWGNLIPKQQIILNEFFSEVSKAQNMNQLKEVVDKAIKSGIRFNFPKQFFQDKLVWEYSFADYVMQSIGILEKNPKVASDIVCKLVSKGALLYYKRSMDVIDKLELAFPDHKVKMKKAYEERVNRTLKLMEIVKSATDGMVKSAIIDNFSAFYLECSGDSRVNVAEITDGARSLGLPQGSIAYGRNIIKIGKSEVEIITANGIRNYTDLADGSDIVVTFHTSLGELEVRLYPDKQNKDLIKVEVRNQEMLKELKDCEEEIGENCSFGRYSVYDAIKQGYFERPGQPSETMSLPKKVSEEVKGLQCGNIVSSSLDDTYPQGAFRRGGRSP
ncbi:ankyrin repeat domain-containing protein [Wolbachia endosymbiont of Cantharis cryptica]|uniref:ankyrin repeat domain-containing protein n=1 Tax=Wolbachia endosymbiont of Cantharis cryptica TaxID=3066132 RepID=UPI00376F1665